MVFDMAAYTEFEDGTGSSIESAAQPGQAGPPPALQLSARRAALRRSMAILGPAIAVLFALGLTAPLIKWSGANPLEAYRLLLRGAFGSVSGLAETLVKASPLWLTGLAVALAFRCGMFNIGGEGQLFMGALAGTYVGVTLAEVPGPLLALLVLSAGFLAGALWAGLAAYLKVRFGANEIIVTIMLNYVAVLIVGQMVHGPLQEPGSSLPQTSLIGQAARLPLLLPGTRLHTGVFVALAALPVIYLILWRTTWGYQVRLVGANPEAARYSGVPMSTTPLLAMALSGGMCGLAGMMEVAALHHRLLESFSPGYGYTAIVVALLGGTHPAGVAISGFVLAGLYVGGNSMQRIVSIPVPIVDVMQGMILFFVVLGPLLQRWISRRERSGPGGTM